MPKALKTEQSTNSNIVLDKTDLIILNLLQQNARVTVKEIAEKLRNIWADHPKRKELNVMLSEIEVSSSSDFYGKGYQDVLTRTPSIAKIHQTFGFKPTIGIDESLRKSLEHFLLEYDTMGRDVDN